MNSIELIVPPAFEITVNNAASTLRKVKLVEEELKKIKEEIDSVCREKLMAKEEVLGLALKFPSPRRTITDAKAAFNAVKGVISPEDFTEICKVGVGDLEKLYKKNTELSQARATIELEQKLGSALEMKQGEPTIILTEVA